MVFAHLLQFMLISTLNTFDWGWLGKIPEGFRLIFPLVLFIISLLVSAGVLYLAGLAVVGGKRARLIDAFKISFFGTILTILFFLFIPYSLIALILSIISYLLLIKGLYETGWLGAIGVGILAVIIYLVLAIILAFIFGIIKEVWELIIPGLF